MRWFVITLFNTSLVGLAHGQDNFGRFKGDPQIRQLADGRNMELLGSLGYVDPSGKEWDAPAGTKVDGTALRTEEVCSIAHEAKMLRPENAGMARYTQYGVLRDAGASSLCTL